MESSIYRDIPLSEFKHVRTIKNTVDTTVSMVECKGRVYVMKAF